MRRRISFRINVVKQTIGSALDDQAGVNLPGVARQCFELQDLEFLERVLLIQANDIPVLG